MTKKGINNSMSQARFNLPLASVKHSKSIRSLSKRSLHNSSQIIPERKAEIPPNQSTEKLLETKEYYTAQNSQLSQSQLSNKMLVKSEKSKQLLTEGHADYMNKMK